MSAACCSMLSGGLQMNQWKWVLLVTGVTVVVSAAITSWYLLTIVWLKALFNG